MSFCMRRWQKATDAALNYWQHHCIAQMQQELHSAYREAELAIAAPEQWFDVPDVGRVWVMSCFHLAWLARQMGQRDEQQRWLELCHAQLLRFASHQTLSDDSRRYQWQLLDRTLVNLLEFYQQQPEPRYLALSSAAIDELVEAKQAAEHHPFPEQLAS